MLPESIFVGTKVVPGVVSTAQHHQRREKSLGTISSVPLRAQSGVDSRYSDHAWDRTAASLLFSAGEAPFTRKTQGFVQILTIKSHPWCVKTKLSCDASLEIPRGEDVKTKLLCDASLKFQELKMWKRSFLLCSALLYSTLLYSTLLCSSFPLLYSSLL